MNYQDLVTAKAGKKILSTRGRGTENSRAALSRLKEFNCFVVIYLTKCKKESKIDYSRFELKV